MTDAARLPTGRGRRFCDGCGATLAADNSAHLCSKCHREKRDSLHAPPARLRNDFFETADFRAAFESQHIGKVFKAYRNHPRHLLFLGKALNQEILGRWLGLTQAQVSKLENGKPEQNIEALRNYAQILHLPQHLLWFDLPGQSRLSATEEPTQTPAPPAEPAGVEQNKVGVAKNRTAELSTVIERVQLLEARSIGSSTVDLLSNSAQEALNRPETDLVFGDLMGTELVDLDVALNPSGLSTATLDRFEHIASFVHSHFATVAPSQLLPAVDDYIRTVTRLLRIGQPIAYRRRLCSIAGHLAGQRAWLMFDLSRSSEAEAWYEFALKPASEAGDDALAAWLLGAQSVVAFDRGDANHAKDLLDRAFHHAGRAGDTPVNGWVSALQSRALANLGQEAGAREALVRAEGAPRRVAADTYRHGMDARGGELRISYYEGNALLAIGDLVGARTAFERALEDQGPGHLKGRAV